MSHWWVRRAQGGRYAGLSGAAVGRARGMSRASRGRSKTAALISLAVAALAPAGVGTAAVKNWTGTSGNWSNGANWSGGTAPALNDDVNVVLTDTVVRTVTYDVAAPALNTVALNMTNNLSRPVTLSMPGSNNLSASFLVVGGYNGTVITTGHGAVDQAGGTLTSTDFLVAYGAGSSGRYTLSGGNVAVNGSEWIGYDGYAEFYHSGGTNTLNAGQFGRFAMGYNAGGTGSYYLSGTGALVSNRPEHIGYSGTGYFTQSGGTNTITGGQPLVIGHLSGSNGAYGITGGTLTVGSDLHVGNSGTGNLFIDGGSVHVPNNLLINSNSNVYLRGGKLRFAGMGGSGGLSRFNYTAGIIQLPGNHDDTFGGWLRTLYGPSGVNIQQGKGAIIEGNLTLNNDRFTTFTVNGGSFQAQNIDLGTVFGLYGQLAVVNGGVVTVKGNVRGHISEDSAATSILVSGPGSKLMVDGYMNSSISGRGKVMIENGGLVHLGQYISGETYRKSVYLNGGTLRFSMASNFDAWLEYNSGTIQLSGNREIGAGNDDVNTDVIVADLFGRAPIIPTGKGLTIEGIATLLGATTVDGGTLTVNQLNNGYNLHLLRGTLNIQNQVVTVGTGGPLGSSLDVDADTAINVALGITNQGLVTGDGQIGGPFTNAAGGELRAQAGRSLRLIGAGTNAGQIRLLGGELEFTQGLTNNVAGVVSGNGSLVAGGAGIVNHGVMNFAGTANVIGDVTNAAGARIVSGGGGATVFFDDVVNNGEIRTSTNGFSVFFGTVSGPGTFTGTGTVNFEGDLTPGSSPGIIPFGGDVVFGPGAALHAEIGGATAGSQYDQLPIAGDATLDGALQLALINGYVPPPTQQFTLLTHASRAGTFDSIVGYTISAAQAFAVHYADTTTKSIAGQWHNPTLTGVIDVPGPKLDVTGSGSWSGTLVKRGSGAMEVALGSSAVSPGSTLDVQAGSLVLRSDVGDSNANLSVHLTGGNATFEATQRLASLELANGTTATLTAGGNKTLRVASLTLDTASGTKLDLKDNKLIVTAGDAGTASGGAYSGLQGEVQRAYNFGSWDAPGLTTSTQGALDGLTTIGVATGEQIRGLGPADTDSWAGQTINGASVIAMYTYSGDANLDGQVDAGDYGILDAFIQMPGASGYGNGDFNYDGFIDPADYGTIDNSIQFQGAPFPTSGSAAALSSVSAVPEPAACGFAALAGGLLIRRRRGK